MTAVRRFILSFLAVLIGWAAGFIYFVVYMTFFSSWGRPTDVEAIMFWTAIFIFIAWILVVLPFVLLISDSSRFFSVPVAALIGAVAGLVTFLLLVGWWTGLWSEGLYLGYALVVGGSTGLTYSILFRFLMRKVGKEAERSA